MQRRDKSLAKANMHQSETNAVGLHHNNLRHTEYRRKIVEIIRRQEKFPSRVSIISGGAFDSAKKHKRQRRKRQSVTTKREKWQTQKFV